MVKKSIDLENTAAFRLLNEQAEENTVETPKPAEVEENTSEKTPITDDLFQWPRDYTLKKERKSKRLQLLVTPTMADKLQKMKDETGQSINDFIGQVLEDVLQKY